MSLAISVASNAQLIVGGDLSSGNIDDGSTNGTKSVFASGQRSCYALGFSSSGSLFESDLSAGAVYEFGTNGVRSACATGLGQQAGLIVLPSEAVPETSTVVLLGLGGMGVLILLSRRKRA
jgi:hypothetical protein